MTLDIYADLFDDDLEAVATALDEILVHIVPVLLGHGVRLFDHPGVPNVELELVSVSGAPQGTNMWLTVVR